MQAFVGEAVVVGLIVLIVSSVMLAASAFVFKPAHTEPGEFGALAYSGEKPITESRLDVLTAVVGVFTLGVVGWTGWANWQAAKGTEGSAAAEERSAGTAREAAAFSVMASILAAAPLVIPTLKKESGAIEIKNRGSSTAHNIYCRIFTEGQ